MNISKRQKNILEGDINLVKMSSDAMLNYDKYSEEYHAAQRQFVFSVARVLSGILNTMDEEVGDE